VLSADLVDRANFVITAVAVAVAVAVTVTATTDGTSAGFGKQFLGVGPRLSYSIATAVISYFFRNVFVFVFVLSLRLIHIF
jgi:ABC-type lipoprotein release transport system permease subunit